MKFGFVIDNRKCIGCHACTVACKSEHNVPIGVNRTWVKYIEKGTFPNTRRIFSVMRCNHCDNAPCVEICPVGALFNREDGIVDFNKERCIGCKSCTQACPYNAIYIDPNTNTAAKCNYCAHKVETGMRPACVIVCPEEAIVSGDLDDPNSNINALLARQQVQTRKPEKGTIPKLYYINGDASSLNPLAAPPTNQYVQTEQAAGVGHYARYAEKRLAQADLEKMKESLAKGAAQYEGENRADYGMKLHDTRSELAKMADEGTGLLKQETRRTHDIPDKGVLWGWELPAYLWSKAVAAGMFFLTVGASLLKLAHIPEQTQLIAGFGSLGFLGLTAAFLIKDLDRPDRFLYVLLRPQWKSWLVRGGMILNAFAGSVTLWLAGKFLQIELLTTIAGWTGVVSATGLAVYTAFLLAQAKGRDFWQSPVLPLHMAVHGLMAGAAAMLIASLFVSYSPLNWMNLLKWVLTGSIAFNLLTLAAELLMPHPSADSKIAAMMITKTKFAPLFYGGVLLAGNIAPVILLFAGGIPAATLAAGLVLIGIMLVEHIWIRAPQLIPLS